MKTRNFFLLLIILASADILGNAELKKIAYYDSLLPQNIELRERVLTTICCRDCDYLPKVEHAGKVIAEQGQEYQLMHNGIKIIKDCYYGTWMTTLIQLLHGHHEPQEEKIFHEILKYIPTHATMVELGSYWGYYSMWFQQKIINAQNFLIEPDSKNIVIGKKHFGLNNMHGHFIKAMVGATSNEHQLFTDWNYNNHEIEMLCIDDFAEKNNIDFIYLLHSDIQGAEINMLKGCQQLIAQKRIGYFFISTHRGTHEACLKILTEAHLHIILEHTRAESFSADGLIVAKLQEIPGPEALDVSRRTVEFCSMVKEVINNEDKN